MNSYCKNIFSFKQFREIFGFLKIRNFKNKIRGEKLCIWLMKQKKYSSSGLTI